MVTRLSLTSAIVLVFALVFSAHAEEIYKKYDHARAVQLLEKFKQVSLDRRFHAPKNLTWLLENEDSQFLYDTGFRHLIGDGVKQDMEIAAILLGGLQTMTTENPWLSNQSFKAIKLNDKIIHAVGHAAHSTATQYMRDADDGKRKRIAEGYLTLAAEADNQAAYLARGYMFRSRRNNQKQSLHRRYVASSHETENFRAAEACNDEKVSRKISPWISEICKKSALEAEKSAIASQKLLIAVQQEKRTVNVADMTATDWLLVAVAGVVAIQVSDLLAGNVAPAMSDAEWHKQQAERNAAAMESTWGHVGGALFLQ